MPRPPIEVADVIRAAGESFIRCSQKWFTWLHLKVLNAILRCRTAALGGHVDACSKCGHTAVSFNSCRNRHCPRCQSNARDRWLAAREQHALRYLGQYTHRVAISNHRLVALADGMVTFRWRDSAHKNKKRLMTLDVNEFLRRFFLHVLPPRFVRIRHFGFLADRRRGAELPLCSQLLAEFGRVQPETPIEGQTASSTPALWTCPQCGGPMVLIERLSPIQLRLRSPPTAAAPSL
jgi:predicted RNA-binding Zn-ribbon protein involved in translation (DUF1610 family)